MAGCGRERDGIAAKQAQTMPLGVKQSPHCSSPDQSRRLVLTHQFGEVVAGVSEVDSVPEAAGVV
jgi:hypothetical protein